MPSFPEIPLSPAMLHAVVFRMSGNGEASENDVFKRRDVMKFFSEEDESKLDSGTSEEEEAELEHQLRIFGDESR